MVSWEQYVYFLSYTISYLIVSFLSNVFLIVESRGTKFRWSLNPYKPYLRKNVAIAIAIAQFVVPFILAMFIDDVVRSFVIGSVKYLYAISMTTFTTVYLFIRQELPYKFSWSEKVGIIGVYGAAILLVVLFHFYL